MARSIPSWIPERWPNQNHQAYW